MNESNNKIWRIDLHHHVVPPQYVDSSMPISIPDTQSQLQSMDSWRIQTAITSLTPRVILKNLHRLCEVARTCNEFQAQRVREHPSRFGAFALLPLPDIDGALNELSYALDVLRLDGVVLFSSVNDRYLGDPLFDPVFDELNRRKAVVFIHPTHCEAPEHTNLHAPPFVVEYVFEHHARHCQSHFHRHDQALSRDPIRRRARRRRRAVSHAEKLDDGRTSAC